MLAVTATVLPPIGNGASEAFVSRQASWVASFADVHLAREHHELVAAEPGHCVGGPDGVAQATRNRRSGARRRPGGPRSR